MTPVLSYWSSDDLIWLDGKGVDGDGPCASDTPAKCLDSVKFYDFSIEDIGGQSKPDFEVKDKDAAITIHQDTIGKAGDGTEAIPGIGDGNSGGFCCLASRDKSNFC